MDQHELVVSRGLRERGFRRGAATRCRRGRPRSSSAVAHRGDKAALIGCVMTSPPTQAAPRPRSPRNHPGATSSRPGRPLEVNNVTGQGQSGGSRQTLGPSALLVRLPVLTVEDGLRFLVVAGRPEQKHWWRTFHRPWSARLVRGGHRYDVVGQVLAGTERVMALTTYGAIPPGSCRWIGSTTPVIAFVRVEPSQPALAFEGQEEAARQRHDDGA